MQPKFDIIFLSPKSWEEFQRFGFRKRAGRILLALIKSAKVRKILFIERRAFSKRLYSLNASPLDKINNGLYRLSLKYIFPFSRIFLIKRLNDYIHATLINKMQKYLNFENSIAWFYDLVEIGIATRLKSAKTVMEVTELPEYFYQDDKRMLKRLPLFYHQACSKVDYISIVSKRMQAKFAQARAEVVLSPNAIDSSSLEEKDSDYPIPEDLKEIASPMVGIIGTDFSLNYRLDFATVRYIAEEMPHISVAIVGCERKKEKLQQLQRYKNITLLGLKHYDQIPKYIHRFNVCLLPYKQPASAGDPLKLYQYLQAGKPVVTYPLDMIEKIRAVVKIANSKEEFLRYIVQSLKEDNKALIKARKAALAGHTWDNRVEEILGIIAADQKGGSGNGQTEHIRSQYQ